MFNGLSGMSNIFGLFVERSYYNTQKRNIFHKCYKYVKSACCELNEQRRNPRAKHSTKTA